MQSIYHYHLPATGLYCIWEIEESASPNKASLLVREGGRKREREREGKRKRETEPWRESIVPDIVCMCE